MYLIKIILLHIINIKMALYIKYKIDWFNKYKKYFKQLI